MSNENGPADNPTNDENVTISEPEQGPQAEGAAEGAGVVMSDAPSKAEGADGVIGGRVTGTDSDDLLSGLTGGDTDTSA